MKSLGICCLPLCVQCHNTHRCQIKRFWHRSRDVRELAPLCTQTQMYKQINQTNYTSLSLSQTSVFYCLSPLPLPRKCFFIAWVKLAPEQSRWSRLGHQVINGGASMPNASQVNLARVLAYIVEGRYSPLLYYSLHLPIQGHYGIYILHLYKATNSNREKN